MSTSFSQRKGTAETWRFSIGRGDGLPLGYDGTEELTFRLLPGPGRAPALEKAGEWDPAPDAAKVEIVAADLAGLGAGLYAADLIVDGGAAGTAWAGEFLLLAAAGGLDAPRTYCDLDDLETFAPGILRIWRKTDGLNFERQRAEAARHLESVLFAHDRPCWLDYPNTASARAWSIRGDGHLLRSKSLTDWIAAGFIMRTEEVRIACACYAIGLIYRSQAGQGQQPSNYQMQAGGFLERASALFRSIVVQFDTDGDGEPDWAIDLSRCD